MLEDTSEDEREESAYETDPEDEEELPLEDEEREYEDEDDEEEEDTRKWSDKGKASDREVTLLNLLVLWRRRILGPSN